mgnify:CR=1 FL=1|jgi:hypothetical protein
MVKCINIITILTRQYNKIQLIIGTYYTRSFNDTRSYYLDRVFVKKVLLDSVMWVKA